MKRNPLLGEADRRKTQLNSLDSSDRSEIQPRGREQSSEGDVIFGWQMSKSAGPAIDIHELPPLATKKQVADWAGVSTRQIEILTKAGAFPDPIRIGTRPRWRRSDLLAWLDQQRRVPDGGAE